MTDSRRSSPGYDDLDLDHRIMLLRHAIQDVEAMEDDASGLRKELKALVEAEERV